MVFLTTILLEIFKIRLQASHTSVEVVSVDQNRIDINRVVKYPGHVSLLAIQSQLPETRVGWAGPGFRSQLISLRIFLRLSESSRWRENLFDPLFNFATIGL